MSTPAVSLIFAVDIGTIINHIRLDPRWREKINLFFIFTLLCGVWKVFMKAFKAFAKPFEASQRSVKIKFKLILISTNMKCTGREGLRYFVPILFFTSIFSSRSSCSEVFCKKKAFLKLWQNSQENTSAIVYFLIKLLRPATLLKKRLWNRRSAVNFAKFFEWILRLTLSAASGAEYTGKHWNKLQNWYIGQGLMLDILEVISFT